MTWLIAGWTAVMTLVFLIERWRQRRLRARAWRGTAEPEAGQPEEEKVGPLLIPEKVAFARVTIHQRSWTLPGDRYHDGSTIWMERGQRTLSVDPFVLRLEDGRRLHVQPAPGKTRIACDLGPRVFDGGWVRRGELHYGEPLLVAGELASQGSGAAVVGPYRGSGDPAREALRNPSHRTLWLMRESTLRRHARAQLKAHLLFVPAALVSLCALAWLSSVGVTLARKDQDSLTVLAWFAVLFGIALWLRFWRRAQPWYQRRRLNEVNWENNW